MSFGHGPFDRLGHAAETLVRRSEGSINSVGNYGSWVKSKFTSFYNNCYFENTTYRIDQVLKIVQIASPDTTNDNTMHAGQNLGKTYRWAVRYRYKNTSDNSTAYDNMTFVLKQTGEFTGYSRAACNSYKKYMFLSAGAASAGSATTLQTPFFTSLASGGGSAAVYSWESHATGGCIGAPALGSNTSSGSGAWAIHNKPDYTVNGTSKPWRLTTYNCQNGSIASTTYHTSKSSAQSAASNHVGDEYETYKPKDCNLSSWSSWSSYTACANGKKTRTRTRTVTTPAENGGRCDWPLTDTQEKSCTVDADVACLVSDWSDWTEWAACANNKETRTRTREITRQQANAGQACPALTETEERDCTTGGGSGGGGIIDETIPVDPLSGGSAPPTTGLPTWAIPAGIGAVALVIIASL
jgi:hypothetical protein